MAWDEKPAKITKVYRRNNYWHIETEGSGFGFDAKYTKGIPNPKVGDEIICHTINFSTVRGVTLRGQLLYMKTKEEIEQEVLERALQTDERKRKEFLRERKKLDNDYASLPIEFQRRISWFRAHNPDFRWDLEAYEMSVCVDAVKIAVARKTVKGVISFSKMSYEKQMETVPGLFEGHSGNSFSAAIMLARLYLENPLWVIAQHGALTPMLGCDKYGCAHPRPKDVMDAIEEQVAA